MPNPIAHLEFLMSRRTRRRFLNDSVPVDILKRALQAASYAPSGANAQPWEFVLIPQGNHRKEIQEMCEVADRRFHEKAPLWLQQWFQEQNVTIEKIYFDTAPWLICVFGRRDLPYWLPSVWLAISQLVNQLHAENIGSVVYTPTLGKDFNRFLGVEENWSLQAMLPVGYPDPEEKIKERPRISIHEKTLIYTQAGLKNLENLST